MPKYSLGISAFYHDSAAALVCDGVVVAAAQEERFTRIKHDSAFPTNAIQSCLDEVGVNLSQVETIVFYDKPLLKFERLLQTYIGLAPRGFTSFLQSMPVWIKDKIFLKDNLKKELALHFKLEGKESDKKLKFAYHHESHAASAFYASPYEEAAVLCVDGVGEWATTSVWLGQKEQLIPLWEIRFPHSLGLLYSAFTYYTGFKVNSGEYKVMGLAPYGRPVYVDKILKNLIDVKDDGTFRLNMDYFDYATGLKMTSAKFDQLFDGPPRRSESELTQKEMDLARSVQEVTELVMLKLARTIRKETGAKNLCMAGGVALNCVANGKISHAKIFDKIWIQPAAGDAGGALGAAYLGHYKVLNGMRPAQTQFDGMQGSFLGPRNDLSESVAALTSIGAVFHQTNDDKIFDEISSLLQDGKIIGWVQGRMEFGPRALGARSILGNPKIATMQSDMNLKIKFRESFRPFAPAVLLEEVAEYFDFAEESPYMLMVSEVSAKVKTEVQDSNKFGIEKLKQHRSTIPAVTHVDYSARIQTVSADTNERFFKLLSQFKMKTGCSVLINTSFNVRGEPIVRTAEDAYRCFMRTNMDVLVVDNLIMLKSTQPEWKEIKNWKQEFQLD